MKKKKSVHIFAMKQFDTSFDVWQYAEIKRLQITTIRRYFLKGAWVYTYSFLDTKKA